LPLCLLKEARANAMNLLTTLLATGLVCIHLFASQLRFLNTVPRSRWLSIAGGVSVAYVFIHILPELSEGQEEFKQIGETGIIRYLEHHVYLLALAGLAIFYGLERMAKLSRQRNRKAGRGDSTSAGVFWLHIASFAVYNALIGYLLLHREEQTVQSLFFFFFAIGLHLVVNDNSLREHHKRNYDRLGRWILSAAVFVGFLIGLVTEIQALALAALFAFLAGGIILNVLKEELPEERESRFWAFALGAAAYAALLVAA